MTSQSGLLPVSPSLKVVIGTNVLLVSISSRSRYHSIFRSLIDDADYIVTNDAHFNVLKPIPFPKVNVIFADEFQYLLSAI